MKKVNISLSTSLVISLLLFQCSKPDPNVNDEGTNELTLLEIEEPLTAAEVAYEETIYVPIYSDIYLDKNNQKNLLAATLSIRNTSYTDSLFISQIDYFNTEGNLVRRYLENTISLAPMGTINYVIEKEDDTGGAGANFIVRLSAKSPHIKPLVQAVMIGEVGNKGFAFSTDGYSVGK